MTIYGEYLFVENFITTFLLLKLTAKLVGKSPNTIRILASSILGAISSFIIFVPMTGALSVLIRIMAGVICIIMAFGKSHLLKIILLYHILTFTSGGMILALSMWIKQPAISHQGILYVDSLTYLRLVLFGSIAFGITYWFVRYVRESKIKENLFGKVTIIFDGKSYCFRAFVDSGNSLYEPISRRPVILIDSKGSKSFPFLVNSYPDRYGIIPYKTVGISSGSLVGLRSDKVIYGNRIEENVYIALFDGCFDNYEVLIHKDFLEEGLLKHEY